MQVQEEVKAEAEAEEVIWRVKVQQVVLEQQPEEQEGCLWWQGRRLARHAGGAGWVAPLRGQEAGSALTSPPMTEREREA